MEVETTAVGEAEFAVDNVNGKVSTTTNAEEECAVNDVNMEDSSGGGGKYYDVDDRS